MLYATKKMGVEKCGGNILIKHFKKFSDEGSFASKSNLDATSLAKDDYGRFKLIGAVFHNGGLKGGHYTAETIDPISNEGIIFRSYKNDKRDAHSKWAYIIKE